MTTNTGVKWESNGTWTPTCVRNGVGAGTAGVGTGSGWITVSAATAPSSSSGRFLMGTATNVCVFEGYRLCKVHRAKEHNENSIFSLNFHCPASYRYITFPLPLLKVISAIKQKCDLKIFIVSLSPPHGFDNAWCNSDCPMGEKKRVTRRFTYTEFITRFHIQPSKGGIFLSGEGWNSGGAPQRKSFNFYCLFHCQILHMLSVFIHLNSKYADKILKGSHVKHTVSYTTRNQTLSWHPVPSSSSF